MPNLSVINDTEINGLDEGVGVARVYLTNTIFDVGEASVEFLSIVADLGAPIVDFTQTVFDLGEASVDFSIRVLHGGEAGVFFEERVFIEGAPIAYFKEIVIDPGEATVDFEVIVALGVGEASVEFEQTVFDTSLDQPTGGASVNFTIAVLDDTLPALESSPNWSLQVLVTRNDSSFEDVSTDLIGTVEIEIEEGSARIATLYIEPRLNYTTGPQLHNYIGAQVEINCNLVSNDGLTSSVYRLFTGEVDSPEYDISQDILTLVCTDNLQSRFESKNKEDIDAMLPQGFWSSYVFSETESMWEYAQNRISTMPYSVDLDAYGSGIRVTQWDTESSAATFIFAEDIIDDQSLDVSLAGKRDMRNTLNLEAEFRYPRLKLRKRSLGWNYGMDFYDYLGKPFPLPSKDMIRGAVEGTGWPIESIYYDVRPMSDVFTGPGDPRIWVNATPKADEQYCVGFYSKLQKRWTQSITERFIVNIVAESSVGTIGEVSYEDSLSVGVDADSSEWDNSLDNDESLEPFAGGVRIASIGGTVSVNPFEVPDEAYLQANGDYVIDWDAYPDDGNLEEFTYAFETIYNQARTEIRSAHRGNVVRFSIPVNPLVDVIHTCFVDTARVAAKGKASHVTHRFDIETGEATTDVVIAVSIGFGGTDEEVFELPTRPNTDFSGLTESPDTPAHLTQIGGEIDSFRFIESMNGWSTNYDSAFGVDPTYPEENYYPTRFQAQTPEIEEEATAPVDAQVDESARAVYKIYIPNDVFKLYSYDEV